MRTQVSSHVSDAKKRRMKIGVLTLVVTIVAIAKNSLTTVNAWIVVLLAIYLSSIPAGTTTAASPDRQLTRAAYGIDFWRAAEGLPQSRIRAISQTRDGYLWLGTDNGLVRFNGSSFKAFTIETGSLKDNEVWALQEDNDGGLWIGTYGGGLTLLKDGRFRTFTMADGLPDDIIRKLDKDGDGNIWMITPKGAGRYSRGVFTKFTTSDGLSDNSALGLATGCFAGIVVAAGSRLHRFSNNRFDVIEGIDSAVSSRNIIGLRFRGVTCSLSGRPSGCPTQSLPRIVGDRSRYQKARRVIFRLADTTKASATTYFTVQQLVLRGSVQE